MSSAGTPRSTVRIPTELMERIQTQIDSLLVHSPKGDWTVGEFIRVACEEKLKKMARSRGSRGQPRELVGGHQVAAVPPGPSRRPPGQRKPGVAFAPLLDMIMFRTVWCRLAEQGKCDAPDGAEYERVQGEYIEAGYPANVEVFIVNATKCPLPRG